MSKHFPKYGAKKPAKPIWRTLVDNHSPYLSALLQDRPESFAANPEDEFAGILSDAEKKLSGKNADIMKILRQAKANIAALTAVADMSGLWSDLTVMQHLSLFADFCTRHAVRHLLLKAHAEKKIKLRSLKQPEDGSGVVVIALGKWGAYELNYSSDIDLMVIFDPQKAPVANEAETQNFFIRFTRDLARIIDQPSEDGYVFRTDLRLRPDPGAMP